VEGILVMTKDESVIHHSQQFFTLRTFWPSG